MREKRVKKAADLPEADGKETMVNAAKGGSEAAPARPQRKSISRKGQQKCAAKIEGATGVSRPMENSPEWTERICEGLSGGTPISILCTEPGMPSARTVRDWLESDADFAEEVAMAREAGFDRIAMEALEIADDSSNDTVETRSGFAPNRDWLARAKMRVDTRLKLLAKWDMKRYGGKAGASEGEERIKMLGNCISEELQEKLLAKTLEAARVAAQVRGPAVFRGEERGE